jgi:hypothetical protein
MKTSPLFAVSALVLAGCASVEPPKSTAQPFAVLYGARKAQWLSNYQKGAFSHKNDSVSFHDIEISGFPNLDSQNQKLYLVVRLCTHQSGNAEDGSQMLRLISALKCSKKELTQYIESLDRTALKMYASALHGSIEQFDINRRIYLQ